MKTGKAVAVASLRRGGGGGADCPGNTTQGGDTPLKIVAEFRENTENAGQTTSEGGVVTRRQLKSSSLCRRR